MRNSNVWMKGILMLRHRLTEEPWERIKDMFDPADVTEGYQLVGTEHLRSCVEKVAVLLLARMGKSL